MFRRVLRHLFGAYAALPFLLILSTHHSCSATKNTSNYCAPSSCGNIRNISYPFRLNTDPESCGVKSYELACENNVRPALYLDMAKYYVQAINYSDFTIRVVDAAVQKDDCFSIPHHSITEYRSLSSADGNYYYEINWPDSSVLTFLCCKNQMLNPPGYIMDASSCKNGSGTAYNSSSSSSISSPSCVDMEGHSYVMVDGDIIKDVPDLCRINLIYYVPKNMTNMSYTDVHDVLVYGFELSWLTFCCEDITENRCNLDIIKYNHCLQHKRYQEPYLLTTLVEPFLDGIFWTICRITGEDCAGRITIPSVLLRFLMFFLPMILAFIVIYHVLLLACGFPCLLTLLIYKWRRRHLSMYDDIEKFLQSHDNDLMPIRYTYSYIKKITNGFKDKLGEGGFGSVYKGKLRQWSFCSS